eukprot:gene14034-biopygen18606
MTAPSLPTHLTGLAQQRRRTGEPRARGLRAGLRGVGLLLLLWLGRGQVLLEGKGKGYILTYFAGTCQWVIMPGGLGRPSSPVSKGCNRTWRAPDSRDCPSLRCMRTALACVCPAPHRNLWSGRISTVVSRWHPVLLCAIPCDSVGSHVSVLFCTVPCCSVLFRAIPLVPQISGISGLFRLFRIRAPPQVHPTHPVQSVYTVHHIYYTVQCLGYMG